MKAPNKPQKDAGAYVRMIDKAKGARISKLRFYWTRSLMIKYASKSIVEMIKATK